MINRTWNRKWLYIPTFSRPADIYQGLLGNCWFISALALIAERPDILERIFVTKHYDSFGVYQLSLCIDGLWRTVVIDDFFPCQPNRTMIFAVGRNNQVSQFTMFNWWLSFPAMAVISWEGARQKLWRLFAFTCWTNAWGFSHTDWLSLHQYRHR